MIQAIQARLPQVYSIDLIREEATRLVQTGLMGRQQPIYGLCNYIPTREWQGVESELEKHGFLLRDRLGDLLSQETWDND
ncbi:MAG: DUF4327 family protein [Leptolyngbyaceae cyanobacterium]